MGGAVAPIKTNSIGKVSLPFHLRRQRSRRMDGSARATEDFTAGSNEIHIIDQVTAWDIKRMRKEIGENTLRNNAKRIYKINDLRWTTDMNGYEETSDSLGISNHIVEFIQEYIRGDRAYLDASNGWHGITGLVGRYAISAGVEVRFTDNVVIGEELAEDYWATYEADTGLPYVRMMIYKNDAIYNPLLASTGFRVYNTANDDYYYSQVIGLNGHDIITLNKSDKVDIRLSMVSILPPNDIRIRITGFVNMNFKDYKTRTI